MDETQQPGKGEQRGMAGKEGPADPSLEGGPSRDAEEGQRREMGECGPRIYSCCNCRCHVAEHDDVISKAFQGRNGRAYLFQNVVNVSVGPKEDRQLITGLHTVADIQCFECQEVLGWKYEKAYDEAQKYKEGKYILEKAKVMKEDW